MSETESGVSPTHKMAVVGFLERVYGVTDPIVLLNLLERAFLPDIKLALRVVATVSKVVSMVRNFERLYTSFSVHVCMPVCACVCVCN